MRKKTNSRTRRNFIRTTGVAGAVALAGCTGSDPGDGGGDGGGGDGTSGEGSGGTTKSQGGKEITFLTGQSTSTTQEVFEDIGAEFEEQTGHTIEYEYVSFENADERLSSMLRSGNPPELISQPMAEIAVFQQDGLLTPVTDVLPDIGDIPDNLILSKDGEAWAVPQLVITSCSGIRGDLVEKAGYSLPKDRTKVDYDTYYEWVSAIDELEDDVRGNAIISSTASMGHATTLDFLWGNGVDVWRGNADNIEVTLDKGRDRKRAIDTAEFMNRCHQHSPPAANWSWGEASSGFAAGSVAAVAYPFGRLLAASRESNPEIAPNVEGIITPFQQKRDNGLSTYSSVESFGVFKDSENPDVAQEYLKVFFNSDRYVDFLLSVPLHYDPPIPELYDHPKYKNNPTIKQFPEGAELKRQLLDQSTPLAVVSDDGLPVPSAGTAYQNGVLGNIPARVNIKGMDPGEAIDITAQELRKLIK